MSEEHVVFLGEHLARIAGFRGFRSYAPLWNDPANAALRRLRNNPNILAVGDNAHVPTLELREVDRPTEKRHRFRAELYPLVVRLTFKTWTDKPVPDQATDVVVDGKSVKFEAGPGKLEFPVDSTSDRCLIKIDKAEVSARVGFLQPVATVAGQRERLNNLGYRAGQADDPGNIDFRSAVEEFQCDQKLVVDGKCGSGTQNRLAAVYGC
ncbi:MAG: peptidoglycan-binding domain-containing protein [Gemmatimonadota bacterium]